MERVSVEQFRASAVDRTPPVRDTEWVPLGEAIGRVASEAVPVRIPLPSFRRAAVDGWAIRAADREQPLRVVGKITAGHPESRPLGPGEAYEITTGAPVPDGADAVALVEESERVGDVVHIREAVVPGSHVSPVGEDFRPGQILVAPDAVLNTVAIAALASQGIERVAVWRRPRVAIVSTGDELTPLGQALGPGRVYDVNGAALEAMVRAAGGLPERRGVWPDRYEAVREGLRTLREDPNWDVLITSGGTGASVPLFQGHDVRALHDLIPAVLQEVGELVHHGIRMVPGRPTALGLLGGRPVFCLPGWPYAVLIHFELMVLPALARAAHLPAPRRPVVHARLRQAVSGTPGFTRIIQVRLESGPDGLMATPLLPPPPPSASRMMTQMLEAEGYIVIEDDRHVVEGAEIAVHLDPIRFRGGRPT
jgi:molybdenum cofactor synthesis domain-containing protein